MLKLSCLTSKDMERILALEALERALRDWMKDPSYLTFRPVVRLLKELEQK